jgi:hypothetical protein
MGMFGHDKTDDTTAAQDTATAASADDTVVASEPTPELTLPTPEGSTAPEAPAEPAVAEPSVDMTAPAFPAATMSEPTPDAELTSIGIGTADGALSNLNSLKQEALHELSPLIGHLDQTPDEKYATAKMVYEETKDQNILKDVYEAAKNLSDEKSKAEAIYDIVKKINELK